MRRSAVLLGDYRNPLIVSLVIIITKNEIYKSKINKKGLLSIDTTNKNLINLEYFLSVT